MKNIIRRFNLLIVSLIILVLTNCVGGSGGSSDDSSSGGSSGSGATSVLQSISFNTENVTVTEGLSTQLNVIGKFSNGSTQNYNNLVHWQSLNPEIADISSNLQQQQENSNNAQASENASGLLIASQPGSVTVVATFSTFSASQIITVAEKQIQSISISPSPLETNEKLIISNEFYTNFSAKAQFNNNTEEVLTDDVTWTITDPSKKSLINRFSGQFRPYDTTSDNINIIAEYQAFSDQLTAKVETFILDTIILKISDRTIDSINVEANSHEIIEGQNAKLTALGIAQNGDILDISSIVIWTVNDSTSDFADINISTDGTIYNTKNIIEPLNIGIMNFNSISPDQVSLTIKKRQIISIEVSLPGSDIAVGTNHQLSATGNYDNGDIEIITDEVVWNTDLPNIAVVESVGEGSNRGYLTALSEGSVLITVKRCLNDETDCSYDDPTQYFSATASINIHQLELKSLRIAQFGYSEDLFGTGSIKVDFSNPIPVGIQANIIVYGTFGDNYEQILDLSLDNNIILELSDGSQLTLISQEKKASRVQVGDPSNFGTITARHLPTGNITDTSNDLNIAGTEKMLLDFEIYFEDAPIGKTFVFSKEDEVILNIKKVFSDGSIEVTNINSEITWEFSDDKTTYTDSSSKISISNSGYLLGSEMGTIFIKATVDTYSGSVSNNYLMKIQTNELTLDIPYDGIIPQNSEIQLNFDSSEIGEYTFIFTSKEKSIVSVTNPGSSWFFIPDNNNDCELGHSQPRVSISLPAGNIVFGFDNFDEIEQSENTEYSLVITEGSGYSCTLNP